VADGTEMFNTMSNFQGVPSGHPFSQYLLGRSIRAGRRGGEGSSALSPEEWENRERFATFQHQLAMQGLTHQTNEGLRLHTGQTQNNANLYAAQNAVDDAVSSNKHSRAQEAAELAHKHALEAAQQAHEHKTAQSQQGHEQNITYATHSTNETLREDKGKKKNARKDAKHKERAAEGKASRKAETAAKAKRMVELEKERPGGEIDRSRQFENVATPEETPTTRLMQQERMDVLRNSKYNSEKE
jgi:hypothetical protein